MGEPDGTLHDWTEIKDANDWNGLLLGNGASMALWEGFGYSSLFEIAANDIDNPLTQRDIDLFDEFETKNFEQVLGYLAVTQRAANALGMDLKEVQDAYESIRQALIDAVHRVHIEWDAIPKATLEIIATALSEHLFVYSLNYDLLIYWAMMTDPDSFKDYFWGGEQFDVSDTDIYGKITVVIWLHGGLHLYRDLHGQTYKRQKEQYGKNLLELFGRPFGDAFPLFVSEGSSEDKLHSIRNSDYLSFAFHQFSDHRGPLVVFGTSLGEGDEHIVQQLRSWGSRSIAISMLPGDVHNLRQEQAGLIKSLPKSELHFFDATTHPLGRPWDL